MKGSKKNKSESYDKMTTREQRTFGADGTEAIGYRGYGSKACRPTASPRLPPTIQTSNRMW